MTDDFAKMLKAWMEQGQDMARAFAPAFDGVDLKAFEKMFPALPKDMLEAWFGKTFNPDGLDARTRFLVTITGLVVLGVQSEPQFRVTIRNALAAGATPREIAEVHGVMTFYHDFREHPAGRRVIKLCRAEACQAVGANELAAKAKAKLV